MIDLSPWKRRLGHATYFDSDTVKICSFGVHICGWWGSCKEMISDPPMHRIHLFLGPLGSITFGFLNGASQRWTPLNGYHQQTFSAVTYDPPKWMQCSHSHGQLKCGACRFIPHKLHGACK